MELYTLDQIEASLKTRKQHAVRIVKTNADKQIIYGEVYAPDVIDTYGDIMRASDIEAMAHKFMELELKSTIDVMHDNEPRDAYPIESFIAREGDPDYTPGAWVLGVKINDPDIWADIKRGKLNGFSFEAYARRMPTVVEYDHQMTNFGTTEQAMGHTHLFFAEIDADNKIIAGRTSSDMGHSHEIKSGTATEPAHGHVHRFFV